MRQKDDGLVLRLFTDAVLFAEVM